MKTFLSKSHVSIIKKAFMQLDFDPLAWWFPFKANLLGIVFAYCHKGLVANGLRVTETAST